MKFKLLLVLAVFAANPAHAQLGYIGNLACQPGRTVASSGTGPGNYTTEGAAVLLSDGTPCATYWEVDAGGVSHIIVRCYDPPSGQFGPAVVLSSGVGHDARLARRTNDTLVAGWIDGGGSLLLTSQSDASHVLWDDFSGGAGTWEPVNCASGCMTVDSFGLGVDPYSDEPGYVYNDRWRVRARHWNQAQDVFTGWPTGSPEDELYDGTGVYYQVDHSRLSYGPASGDPYVAWSGQLVSMANAKVALQSWSGTTWMNVGPSLWTTGYSKGYLDLDVDIWGLVHLTAENQVGLSYGVWYTHCGSTGCAGNQGGPVDSISTNGVFPTIEATLFGRPDIVFFCGSLQSFGTLATRWKAGTGAWEGLWTTKYTTVSGGSTFWRPSANHTAQNRLVVTQGKCIGRTPNCSPSEVEVKKECP